MSDQNQPREQHPTVEETPYSVEDTGISNEEKIDRLLATAVAVREELVSRGRRIAKWLVGIGTIMAITIGFAGGVLWGLRDQAKKLTAIAETNRENGTIVRENSTAIREATSPEAAARNRVTLVLAINEIRRSIDCVALYANGERPDACKEVAARMDVIRGGGDPFKS